MKNKAYRHSRIGKFLVEADRKWGAVACISAVPEAPVPLSLWLKRGGHDSQATVCVNAVKINFYQPSFKRH